MDRALVWPHILALLEASLACDNLPCDGLGRPPSAGGSFDVDRGNFNVDLRNAAYAAYASTEIVEVK